MEEFLPLADHAERAIIKEHDFHGQIVTAQRREFLQVHHDGAVAGDVDDAGIGKRELRADGRGQAETHGAEAAAAEMLRGMTEMKVLGDPHLVLANVAGDDAVLAGAIGKSFQKAGGVDFGSGRVVIPRVRFFRGQTFTSPRVDIERAGERGESLAQIAYERNVGASQLADFRRVHVHVNHFRVRREGVEAAGSAIVEASADANQKIARLHGVICGLGAVHAHHAEREFVRGGNRAETFQGGDDRDARGVDEGANSARAPAMPMPPPA